MVCGERCAMRVKGIGAQRDVRHHLSHTATLDIVRAQCSIRLLQGLEIQL